MSPIFVTLDRKMLILLKRDSHFSDFASLVRKHSSSDSDFTDGHYLSIDNMPYVRNAVELEEVCDMQLPECGFHPMIAETFFIMRTRRDSWNGSSR